MAADAAPGLGEVKQQEVRRKVVLRVDAGGVVQVCLLHALCAIAAAKSSVYP